MTTILRTPEIFENFEVWVCLRFIGFSDNFTQAAPYSRVKEYLYGRVKLVREILLHVRSRYWRRDFNQHYLKDHDSFYSL